MPFLRKILNNDVIYSDDSYLGSNEGLKIKD